MAIPFYFLACQFSFAANSHEIKVNFPNALVNWVMQKAAFCIFIVLMLPAKSCFTQQLNIDSLIVQLNKSVEDTNKVIQYRMLAGLLRSSNPLKAVEYGKRGVLLGKALGFHKGVAGCLLNISACYNSASKLDSALIKLQSLFENQNKVTKRHLSKKVYPLVACNRLLIALGIF